MKRSEHEQVERRQRKSDHHHEVDINERIDSRTKGMKNSLGRKDERDWETKERR